MFALIILSLQIKTRNSSSDIFNVSTHIGENWENIKIFAQMYENVEKRFQSKLSNFWIIQYKQKLRFKEKTKICWIFTFTFLFSIPIQILFFSKLHILQYLTLFLMFKFRTKFYFWKLKCSEIAHRPIWVGWMQIHFIFLKISLTRHV
jgi:hypothetical protein